MQDVEPLLASLRAAAEPTRLRLLALAARGSFCVMDFTEILGQSQPRLSRHLRLLCEAGLLDRVREGANVWFTLPAGSNLTLVRELLAHLPEDDAVVAADRRQAARVLAERARVASDSFIRQGSDWDEMRALGLAAPAVEAALLAMVPETGIRTLLDVGTGTGRLLELLAPRVSQAMGVDASKAMLALARSRLARAGLSHCGVRLADMYRLPFKDESFDLAVLQMVLHYAEDPAGVIAEAARVLRPGGVLIVADLADHARRDVMERLAHRWPGFGTEAMDTMLEDAALVPAQPVNVPGPLDVRLWSARRSLAAPARAASGAEPALGAAS